MTRFTLVPERSRLRMEARSSVHPIHGQADGLSGFVELQVTDGAVDLAEKPTAEITLDVDRVTANNDLLDSELRRRVDTQRYPRARGLVTEAREAGGSFEVDGELTFHGVTNPVTGRARARVEGDVLHVEGEFGFDIRDFGLQPPRLLMLKVQPDVRIEVEIVAENGSEKG